MLESTTIWWLLSGTAVALELLTGTFYLLMLAIGLASGALAAHGGASVAFQMIVAAAIGGGAVAGWRLQRSRQAATTAGANRDINLDIGETVQVDGWSSDGTASVKYRGANWTVVASPGAVHGTGAHRICDVVGNRLIVEKI